MQITIPEILNNLSKLKPVIVSEDSDNTDYNEAKYYFVPVYKEDKIFICGWCNTRLMDAEDVVILDPSELLRQSTSMHPLKERNFKTIDFETVRLLKEILWDRLIDESNKLIDQKSFIYPLGKLAD